MTITVTPLSDALGAEISGVDLTRPLDAATAAAINDAFLAHLVIVIRGQDITDADQVRFAGCFGKVGDYLRPKQQRAAVQDDYHQSVMLVSNIRKDGQPIGALPDGEMMFHTDTGYDSAPHKATTLYAIELPSTGGDTVFSNQYAVYDALPDDIRRTLEGRDAFNAYEFGTTIKNKPVYDAPGRPEAVHPVFRPHSETGRMTVYVNELMTERVIGLSEAESRAVLDAVFALQREPRFLYRHKWRIGDLVMWDNRCTLHARTDFPRKERRLLRRVTIEDRAPETADA